jgi:hypothetical protein
MRKTYTGEVTWGILVTEDERSSDTTDATETDKSSTAERTLPLSTNVVALVRHGLWNVGIGSGTYE